MGKKIYTLCMVCQGNDILLGLKKKGLGQGRYNGFGGKVEEGESIETAAHRELQEEAGLTTHAMEKLGVVDFSW